VFSLCPTSAGELDGADSLPSSSRVVEPLDGEALPVELSGCTLCGQLEGSGGDFLADVEPSQLYP
jgi:hypothetical protein